MTICTVSRRNSRRPATRQLLENLEPRVLLSSNSLIAPSSLALSVQSPTSIQLKWTDRDSRAAGYYVLRSTDGSHFSQLARLTSVTVNSYLDTSALSGHRYYYEVKAFTGSVLSKPTNIAATVTPLVAPTNLTVTVSGAYLNLAWTANDANAAGYYVYRSTNNSSYAFLAQLSTTAYTDKSATAGATYYYKVLAVNALTTSPFSNIAFAQAPAPAPAPAPGPTGSVTIATRYGYELVVTGSTANDNILVVQSGSTLTITANGTTSSYAAPAAGLFIYTRGGTDAITIDSSVTLRTTVESIDAANTTIISRGANVTAWIDSTDAFTGTGALHLVASFAGGVSKATGAALANPTDSGTTTTVSRSLWGINPAASDVNQGSIGDCYFLASLAGFAGQAPAKLLQTAVDMGDGTYAVQFKSTFVRVSNAFSVGPFNGFKFAQPGANGTVWAMVMEKAFCYFRTGANTYASISGGWMSEVYSDLNTASSTITPTSYSDASLYSAISAELASGKPVTAGTKSSGTQLVSNHAYTIVSVSTVGGVNYYTVRNPWGVSGDSLENSAGYATLTYAQMTANFSAICLAA